MPTNLKKKKPVVRKKATRTSKRVTKKATKSAPAKRISTNVVMTLKQAQGLQSKLLKAGKTVKFLDSKISLLA